MEDQSSAFGWRWGRTRGLAAVTGMRRLHDEDQVVTQQARQGGMQKPGAWADSAPEQAAQPHGGPGSEQ